MSDSDKTLKTLKTLKDIKVETYYRKDGSVYRTHHTKNGLLHREDGPAYIEYHENGKVYGETYYKDGVYGREDGPAWILYDEDGSTLMMISFALKKEELLPFWDFYDRSSEENQKTLLRVWLPYLSLVAALT
jgi:antitoxin component YwqK of YwqJK toxin-antitoxin module